MENKSTMAAGGGCLICGTVLPMLDRMWAEATNNHFRNSQVEFLKGLRSLIDIGINKLSPEETKGTRVVVE